MNIRSTIIAFAATVAMGLSSYGESVPLTNAKPDLKSLPHNERLTYDVVTVTTDNTARSPGRVEYATLVLETSIADGVVTMVDTYTISSSQPNPWSGVVFSRVLKFRSDDLLRPLSVTLDITFDEEGSEREMSWSDGVMKTSDGREEPVQFDKGILTDNAMLRLVRVLRPATTTSYSVAQYAEPFLFRIRDAEGPEDCVLTIEGSQNSTQRGDDSADCVFRMKSAVICSKIWLNDDHVPSKIVLPMPEDSGQMEYSLKKTEFPAEKPALPDEGPPSADKETAGAE